MSEAKNLPPDIECPIGCHRKYLVFTAHKERVALMCSSCGCRGPWCVTPDAAIATWRLYVRGKG